MIAHHPQIASFVERKGIDYPSPNGLQRRVGRGISPCKLSRAGHIQSVISRAYKHNGCVGRILGYGGHGKRIQPVGLLQICCHIASGIYGIGGDILYPVGFNIYARGFTGDIITVVTFGKAETERCRPMVYGIQTLAVGRRSEVADLVHRHF